MPLPEIFHKKVEKILGTYCENKIPAHVKSKIKLLFEFRGNSVTLVESRPKYDDPDVWTSTRFAQFRFDADTLKWNLYCSDRNSKWHHYAGPIRSFESLLKEVDQDPTGIFCG